MKSVIRIITTFCVILIGSVFFMGTGVAAADYGDFTVTETTGSVNYNAVTGTLTVNTGATVTISNKSGVLKTSNCIFVEEGASVTLAGVNIDTSATVNRAAFTIADDSDGNVTVTLADGTINTLISGQNAAGLQKNGAYISETEGRLTITGTGTLNATGGEGAAGIGGGVDSIGTNIVISGGSVKAGGATAIGGGYDAVIPTDGADTPKNVYLTKLQFPTADGASASAVLNGNDAKTYARHPNYEYLCFYLPT